MVLNDALKQHKKCLLECEEKHEFCEYESLRDPDCKEVRNICDMNCDFDYSPN